MALKKIPSAYFKVMKAACSSNAEVATEQTALGGRSNGATFGIPVRDSKED
jgi:hypothetical protein